MSKYIFLDIDGVLNNGYEFKLSEYMDIKVDEDLHLRNLLIFKDFIDNCKVNCHDTKIILISSWNLNKYDYLKKIFNLYHIPLWDDSLRYKSYYDMSNKEQNIMQYITENNIDIKNIVIIEDGLRLNSALNSRLINCNPHDGLTHSDCLKAWKLLKLPAYIFNR